MLREPSASRTRIGRGSTDSDFKVAGVQMPTSKCL